MFCQSHFKYSCPLYFECRRVRAVYIRPCGGPKPARFPAACPDILLTDSCLALLVCPVRIISGQRVSRILHTVYDVLPGIADTIHDVIRRIADAGPIVCAVVRHTVYRTVVRGIISIGPVVRQGIVVRRPVVRGSVADLSAASLSFRSVPTLSVSVIFSPFPVVVPLSSLFPHPARSPMQHTHAAHSTYFFQRFIVLFSFFIFSFRRASGQAASACLCLPY